MCEEMRTLVSRFAEYLKKSERQLGCFHTYESQVEGWFKGELICFLDREKRTGRLHDFKREKLVRVGDRRIRKNKIDISLQFDKSSPISWVELKHWYMGNEDNPNYGCHWYFNTARHPSCVKPDAEKLLRIPEDGDKFILVLLTNNPRSKRWNSGVEVFNTRFAPQMLSVRSLTNPSDYPDYFFLGLLHVAEGGQH